MSEWKKFKQESELVMSNDWQRRRWGKTTGEAPEARQVVAETILILFSVTGVGTKRCEWFNTENLRKLDVNNNRSPKVRCRFAFPMPCNA